MLPTVGGVGPSRVLLPPSPVTVVAPSMGAQRQAFLCSKIRRVLFGLTVHRARGPAFGNSCISLLGIPAGLRGRCTSRDGVTC